METQDNKVDKEEQGKPTEDIMISVHRNHRTGRLMGGLIIIAVGVVWLLRQMNMVVFPPWLFTWPVILIVIGIYIGARHSFRTGGWLIMILIGALFLMQNVYSGFNIHIYIWPIVIIGVGLFMLLPRRRYYKKWHDKSYWKDHKKDWKKYKYDYTYSGHYSTSQATPSSEDFIDAVSIFGSVHKMITSKDFKGGDVVNIFGGTEINLTQADIKGKAVLDLTQIFGGTKIIIPSDWQIQSKMVAIFGGIEDKRNPALPKNPDKVLVIDGTSLFAGIDIFSY